MSDTYSYSNGGATDSYNGNGSTASFPPAQQQTPNAGVIRKKPMGFVGFSNLPNQVHRKSVRKGFQFTVMVVGELPRSSNPHPRPLTTVIVFTGESGLGKSTLVNTLFETKLYARKEPLEPSAERAKTVAIESISAGEHQSDGYFHIFFNDKL
jgi:septin 7